MNPHLPQAKSIRTHLRVRPNWALKRPVADPTDTWYYRLRAEMFWHNNSSNSFLGCRHESYASESTGYVDVWHHTYSWFNTCSFNAGCEVVASFQSNLTCEHVHNKSSSFPRKSCLGNAFVITKEIHARRIGQTIVALNHGNLPLSRKFSKTSSFPNCVATLISTHFWKRCIHFGFLSENNNSG